MIDDIQTMQRAVDKADAYARLVAKARRRKYVHIVLMALCFVLTLATTAWMLILVAVNWAAASVYEQLDPHVYKRVRDDHARWLHQLNQEEASHHVIENMKAEVFHRRNPWARVALAAALPFVMWGLIRRKP